MMRKINLILILFLISACHRKVKRIEMSYEDKFELGCSYFKEKKYKKAAKIFEELIYESAGKSQMDVVEYYLAKSYFMMKQYKKASSEYEFFLEHFSRSKYADDAEFELAVCYYKMSPNVNLDQSLTKKALRMFEKFIEKYPESKYVEDAKKYRIKCINKLAKKEIITAKFYMKQKKWKAAEIYLESVKREFPESTLIPEVEKLLAICKKHGS